VCHFVFLNSWFGPEHDSPGPPIRIDRRRLLSKRGWSRRRFGESGPVAAVRTQFALFVFRDHFFGHIGGFGLLLLGGKSGGARLSGGFRFGDSAVARLDLLANPSRSASVSS